MAFDKRKALQNALAYTQQGKWDRAIVEYQSILKADPRDVTVCNNLGDLYARAGKTADAIDQYLKLGELYRADGLSVKAIAVYKKIAKLDPARTEAHLACADLYWEQGLVGEAKIQMATVVEHYSKAGDAPKLIDAYKRLSQFDPANSALVTRLADLMLREGKREAAAVEYERAAQAAQAAGQAAEAKRLLQKARDLLPSAPAAPEAKVPLAERLIGEGRIPEGIDVLRAVTRAEPEDAKAWRLLGEVQASQRQAGEAIAALQRALALGIAEWEIARPLGLALLEADRADDAVALCRRLTETGVAKGEPDVAIACCRELLAANPQLTALHTHLAVTLQELGRTEEAAAALRALATTQEGIGETEAAVATYHRLLGVNPSDEHARARLEILEPPPPAVETPEPPAPPAEDEIQPPLVEFGRVPPMETSTLTISSLEDLGLSLGAEDAKLLLEEPDSVVADAAPDVQPSALEPDRGGADTVDESFQTADWLTQELQSIDLDRVVSDEHAQGATVESVADGRSLELDEIVSHLGDAEVSGLAHDPELDLGPSTGLLDEQSSLIDVPTVELPDVPAELGTSLLDLSAQAQKEEALDRPEDDAHASHVAEQLAEADVYQKYGLEEKARERLLEVVRLAPENLTARRRLKAIYLDRRQYEEVCAQVLAIARILRARGQAGAATAEVQEGLLLLPDHQDLQQFLVAAPPPDALPSTAQLVAGLPSGPEQRPNVEAPDASTRDLGGARQIAVDPSADGAPPPDVPLLLELNEAPLSADAADEVLQGGDAGELEALPKELQALLDDSEAEPVVVLDEKDTGHDQAMADDIAEAEFYLSQGMTDEARAVHRRMQARDPQHPAVAALADQLNGAPVVSTQDEPQPVNAQEAPSPEEPAAELTTSPEVGVASQENAAHFTVTDTTPEEAQAGFVDLGAELDQELDAGAETAFADSGGPLVDGLLKELQKGVREQLDEKDYETHYNLGIAYKEMELYDEAIQEFRLTAREAKRALECADLVGLCYLAKGQPEQAIQDLQAGLAVEGQPSEAYHNLRYDLATAFEAVGDLSRALEQFEILHAEGARFLDVQTRLQNLQARSARTPSPAAKDQPPRRKKKISFI